METSPQNHGWITSLASVRVYSHDPRIGRSRFSLTARSWPLNHGWMKTLMGPRASSSSILGIVPPTMPLRVPDSL